MHKRIPFNRPFSTATGVSYIQEAIQAMHIGGWRVHAQVPYVAGRTAGYPKALLTTSCTHALEMAALLLDIQPGDEVIFPAFTFVSTVNAFVLRGAQPVFCDIRADTLNLDEAQIERSITPHTKAIVPVHYAGVGCEMDEILAIADARGYSGCRGQRAWPVGTYKGKYLGTFGCLATQSFHETKNFSCGEGGALLINDERYIERAEIIREKGTEPQPLLPWTSR